MSLESENLQNIQSSKEQTVRHRQVAAKIGICVLSILLTLLLLEIALRLAPITANSLTKPDPHIANIFKPNLNQIIEAEGANPAPRLRTNQYGFIGTDWTLEKTPGTLRLVNLGDSFTAGLAVEHYKNFSTLLGLALTVLRAAPVESLNFGVPGQGTGEALQTYRYYAKQFNPEIVVLWFFLGNDFEDNLVYQENRSALAAGSSVGGVVKRVLRRSALAQWTVNRLARIPAVANFLHGRVLNRVGADTQSSELGLPLTLRLMFTADPENETAINKTKQLLATLRNLVASDKKRLMVVFIPAHFQVDPRVRERLFQQYPQLKEVEFDDRRPNRALAEISESLGIPYVDLTPEFARQCGDTCPLYACDNCHLSAEGHREAAEIVAPILRDYFLK